MHPGVRAAGAGDGHWRAGGPGEGFLQHLLHRQAVELALPARVSGAVVFHGAAVSRLIATSALYHDQPNECRHDQAGVADPHG